MKSFKSFLKEEQELLIESSTADATNAEKAICYAYNRWKWSGDTIEERHEGEEKELISTALSKAGLQEKDYDSFSKLIGIGKNVAKKANLGWGEYLSHAGSNTGYTNHYKDLDLKNKATDTTSKSDFTSTDNKEWNISLKKAGDSGAGAQIMSAKAGEAEGIFKAGIKHYEANKTKEMDNVVNSSLDQLWVDLGKTAEPKLYIQVSGGKKDFANWYKKSTKNPRRALLGKFTPTPDPKQIQKHLDAEMALLGIPTLTKSPENKKKVLLQNIEKKGKKLFKAPRGFKKIESTDDGKVLNKPVKTSIESIYKNDSTWKVGEGQVIGGERNSIMTKGKDEKLRTGTAAVVVNPDHLKGKYETVLADNVNLKKLIVDVVETSIKAKGWAEELTTFYKGNDELKKWFLYEAGSGLYKFTGLTAKSGNVPYKEKGSPVANKLVVFTTGKDGIQGGYENKTIIDWAAEKTGLISAENIDLSYKTSATSGYAAVRFASEAFDSELPMLQEEISRLNAQYLLNEGIFSRGFSWVKDKVTVLLKKLKDIVWNFVQKVFKKIIDKLKELAKKGHTLFMDAMGIEASVQIPTPKW